MKCVQKVTYTLRQRCRHFVRAHSCWNNEVLCHTNQELTGRGRGGRGQHGQIALAMSTKQVWTADPESSTRSQSSMAERSCHMVDLFGKKTNCSSGITCDFRPLATRKDRPEKKYFSKYKQDGLPSRASSAKQKFQTTSLSLIFETDGKSKMATGWQYQYVSQWVYSNDHWGGSIKMCRNESIPMTTGWQYQDVSLWVYSNSFWSFFFFWWEEGRYSHTFDDLSLVPSLSLVALFERGEQRVQTFWQRKVWARYQFQCTLREEKQRERVWGQEPQSWPLGKDITKMWIFGEGKCELVAYFSATVMTSLPSLCLSVCLSLSLSFSLSLSLSHTHTPHTQYTKRFHAW